MKTIAEVAQINGGNKLMEHTPGPWKIGKDTRVIGADSEVVCFGNSANDKNKANARLIAAAPELLEALKEIIGECPDPKLPYGHRINEIARAAIAKAQGGM
jgi:hypothetical protein